MGSLCFNFGVCISKKPDGQDCTLDYIPLWSTLYTKVQEKVNICTTMRSNYCKKGEMLDESMQNMICLNSWKSCSEMFQELVALKFTRKLKWWRKLLLSVQLAASNVTEDRLYYRYIFSINLKGRGYATLLISWFIYFNLIIYYVRHCQETSINQHFSI